MRAIIVVLPRLLDAEKIKKILTAHGFPAVFAYASAAQALAKAREHSYGLIISGCHLTDMYYLELYENLPDFFEMVLLGRADTLAQADAGMLALTMPLKARDLVNTADMVLCQLERRIKKQKPAKKRSEREENYIRNAKFLLMERNHLTEEEAYRYIQKSSMDGGANMAETAQMILALMLDEA